MALNIRSRAVVGVVAGGGVRRQTKGAGEDAVAAAGLRGQHQDRGFRRERGLEGR